MDNVWISLLLTFIAGISTGFGGLIVLFTKDFNKKLFSILLGFSAGVMIYLSFVEMFVDSRIRLVENMGDFLGEIIAVLGFLGGVFLIWIIDIIVPENQNPHEIYCDANSKDRSKCLYKIGIFTAAILFIHNFPEGIATFMSGITDIKFGIFMSIAIMIHNIPEGMAVAVPIYYATNNKKKAMWYSFLSGFAEPIGAILGYLVLAPIINDVVLAIVFAAVAGIMVYIALDELLPAAEKYGEHHLSIMGLIFGMIVIATSLVLI